jgi:malate dehydrogenase
VSQNTNASIVRDLAQAVAEHSPKAFVLIISNPVNSTVPIFAEVLKKAGVFDEKRLFGVTTLDVVRASRFVSEIKGGDPKDINVTVVGGHSGVTIVPLLSQNAQSKSISGEEYKALVKRIQFGGDGECFRKDLAIPYANFSQRSSRPRPVPDPPPSPWVTVSRHLVHPEAS